MCPQASMLACLEAPSKLHVVLSCPDMDKLWGQDLQAVERMKYHDPCLTTVL